MAFPIFQRDQTLSTHSNRRLRASLICAALALTTTAAFAVPVNGTLQLNGSLTIASTSLNFCASAGSCAPSPGNWNVPGSGTGDLANPYANDPNGGLITNLNGVNAPVGTLLPGHGIVLLTFAPSVALPVPDIQFYLTKLLAGVGGSAACGAPPAPGQTCTPVGSALTFTNGAGGTSTATIAIQGEARRISTNEFDSLQMDISTSSFPFPFQTALSVLGGGGSLSTSYGSATTAASPPAAPVFQSAVSRKVHGVAGTFSLPLTLVVTNPTTEPRSGLAQTIVFTFDKPTSAATVTIAEGTATAGAATFSGNDVIASLTGVTDQQYVTVMLTSVASTDGGTGGSASVRIGFLLGDASQSRVVTVADVGLVNAQLAQAVTVANFLKDVNASGTLTVADKSITNANLTRALPPP